MNRILFEKHEIADGVAEFSDARATHAVEILHAEAGQVLKTGEIDGLIGSGTVLSIGKDGSGGEPSYCVKISLDHNLPSLQPWVDLILAPPRPRVMKRLLPQLAAMGVGRIFLVGAQKVEKAFWGATLLKENVYRPLLIDGLMQAGTTALPTVEPRRNFKSFIREELDELLPSQNRIIAHPYGAGGAKVLEGCSGRLVLAVGPEGGWTDEEVAMLEDKGFFRYSLGQRILRTDTATIALLAKLNKEDK